MLDGDILCEDRHCSIAGVLKILRGWSPLFAVLIVDDLIGVDPPEQSCHVWNRTRVIIPARHLITKLIGLGEVYAMLPNAPRVARPSSRLDDSGRCIQSSLRFHLAQTRFQDRRRSRASPIELPIVASASTAATNCYHASPESVCLARSVLRSSR